MRSIIAWDPWNVDLRYLRLSQRCFSGFRSCGIWRYDLFSTFRRIVVPSFWGRSCLEGTSMLRNAGRHSPNNTATWSRRHWNSQVLHLKNAYSETHCHTSAVFQILRKEAIILYVGRNLIVRNDRSVTNITDLFASSDSSYYVRLQTLELFSRLSLAVLCLGVRHVCVLVLWWVERWGFGTSTGHNYKWQITFCLHINTVP